jgi:hypothetical protein
MNGKYVAIIYTTNTIKENVSSLKLVKQAITEIHQPTPSTSPPCVKKSKRKPLVFFHNRKTDK